MPRSAPPGKAHEPLGVVEHRPQGHRRLGALATRAFARTGMCVREYAAQVSPTARVAHEQRQVRDACLSPTTTTPYLLRSTRGHPAFHDRVDLSTMDRP